MQPTYIPWMGYFSLIDKVDEFVFLDSVQIVGRSWQVRNRIKFEGKEKMLTIPMDKSNDRDKRLIYNTKYIDSDWKKNHLAIMSQAYKKSAYFDVIFPFICCLYEKEYESIGDFTENCIRTISEKIGIRTIFSRSIDMDVVGKKDELLVDICKNIGAEVYISAQGSAAYIEMSNPGGAFTRRGVELYYQNYLHPEYKQVDSPFVSHMGIYDLLFNVGFDNALVIIREGQRQDIPCYEFNKK